MKSIDCGRLDTDVAYRDRVLLEGAGVTAPDWLDRVESDAPGARDLTGAIIGLLSEHGPDMESVRETVNRLDGFVSVSAAAGGVCAWLSWLAGDEANAMRYARLAFRLDTGQGLALMVEDAVRMGIRPVWCEEEDYE